MLRYRSIFEYELKNAFEVESLLTNIQWLKEVSVTNLSELLRNDLVKYFLCCNNEQEELYIIRAYTTIIATAIKCNYSSIEEYERSSNIRQKVRKQIESPEKLLEFGYILMDDSLKNLELFDNAVLVLALNKYIENFEIDNFEIESLIEAFMGIIKEMPENMRGYAENMLISSCLNLLYLKNGGQSICVGSPKLVELIHIYHSALI